MSRTMKPTTSVILVNNSSGFSSVLSSSHCNNNSVGLDLEVNALPFWDNLSEIGLFAQSPATAYIALVKNFTCLEHAPKLTNAVYLRVIVLAVMSVLSLVCNLATIYSIVKNRRKQRACYTTIYTLILHLSVADLLVTVFCMIGDAIWSYNVAWLWGNLACKIFKFLQMFSLYLSTFVLVLIGVDRFVAVRYPMRGLNATQKCWRFILAAWILAFVLAIPQVRCIATSRSVNWTILVPVKDIL